MEKTIIVLEGITYNYCEEVRFYSMIGFLNKLGEFKGIEVETQNGMSLSMILKNTKINDIKLVSGILDDSFDYCTMDLDSQEFLGGRLQFYNNQYIGSEFIYDGDRSLILKEELYKVIYSIQTIYNKELETMLASILEMKQYKSTCTKLKKEKSKQLVKKS